MKQLAFPAYPNYTDLKVEDIEWLQSALLSLSEALGKALAQGNDATVVWGCNFTSNGSDEYTMTAGAIYYDGEIFLVDAFAGTGDAVTFTVVEEDDPGDGHKLQSGAAYAVRKNRRLDVAMGASGSGDFQYTRLFASNEVIQPGAGQWMQLTLLNDWTGSAYVRRTMSGMLEFRGSIIGLSATDFIVFALPAEFTGINDDKIQDSGCVLLQMYPLDFVNAWIDDGVHVKVSSGASSVGGVSLAGLRLYTAP